MLGPDRSAPRTWKHHGNVKHGLPIADMAKKSEQGQMIAMDINLFS